MKSEVEWKIDGKAGLWKKQLKDIVSLKEKKNKSQIIQGNKFGISWSRREGKTVRRQDNMASVGTEEQRVQMWHRKLAKARLAG